MKDLISREAVKDEFLTRCSFLPEIDKRIGLIILNDIPSADAVEVKHGRWTENEHITFDSVWGEDVHWFTFTCSVCGGETMKDYPYCPNCGADMRGE